MAKRLIARIKQETNLPVIEYLFQEEDTRLPDLGGIQTTLEKRTRHRRALVRMLFDYYETDRMLICLDPEAFDLIMDFERDRPDMRVLEISCDFSDDYLRGHAARVGLAGQATSPEALERVLPTIRRDVHFEHVRLRDAGFSHYSRIREGASVDENSIELAEFLSVGPEPAKAIASTDHLFVD